MRFADILGRQDGGDDPWDVSAIEHGVVGGTQHDRDYLFLEAVTLRRFTLSHAMRARYPNFHDMGAFIAVVRERYQLRLGTGPGFGWNGEGDPWCYALVVERFMGEVIDCCTHRGVWYHPGFLKVLREIRFELRGEEVRQGGGDRGH